MHDIYLSINVIDMILKKLCNYNHTINFFICPQPKR